ncbi:hypothetical protein KHQ82_09470 [Mycoplasmatota bacterium]|nr:hypothetical protein KHQ82_09470 [Mycoplasmatota bacterium]
MLEIYKEYFKKRGTADIVAYATDIEKEIFVYRLTKTNLGKKKALFMIKKRDSNSYNLLMIDWFYDKFLETIEESSSSIDAVITRMFAVLNKFRRRSIAISVAMLFLLTITLILMFLGYLDIQRFTLIVVAYIYIYRHILRGHFRKFVENEISVKS